MSIYTAKQPFPYRGRQYHRGDTVDLSAVDPGRVAAMVRLGFVVEASSETPAADGPGDLATLKVAELRVRAKAAGVPGVGSMRKPELVAALTQREDSQHGS